MPTKSTLDTQVAVLDVEVKSIKEKQKKDDETLGKILANTHEIMLCQEGTKGQMALVKESMEHNARETDYIREKISSKADKEDLRSLATAIKEVRSEANKKIRRIWKFVWGIPSGLLGAASLATIMYEVFFK